jgi:hypothetical protein
VIEPNVWTHVALTYDGRHERLYINDELVDVEHADPPNPNNGDLRIGCTQKHEDGFQGKIDNVRIYNRALSMAEAIPDATAPTVPSSPSAVLEDEEGHATISWNGSVDPTGADGSAPSGVTGYLVRYEEESEPWSGWQEVTGPAIGIAETVEGEQVQVQVTAVDLEGNQSPVMSASVVPAPTEATIDSMSEEPVNFTEQSDELKPKEIVLDREPIRSEGPIAEASVVNEEKLCEGRGSNPCGHYNGWEAANYAYAWTFPGAEDPEMQSLHNQNFQFFGGNGGDCANFVSQALWKGGMEFLGAHGHNNPNEDLGHHDNSAVYENSEGAWWSAFHYNFFEPPRIFDGPTPAWWNAHELYKHLLEFGLAVQLTHKQKPKAGDLIFFNQGEGIHTANIDHVQMITRVKKNYVQVSQHSNSYHKPFFKVVQKLERKYHQKPGVELWNYFVLEPIHTAANLHEKSLFGEEE